MQQPFHAELRREDLLMVSNIVHHSRGGGALEAIRAVNVPRGILVRSDGGPWSVKKAFDRP